MAKRDLIAAALNEGPKTIEQLCEIADVNTKGLASQFSYLRLTGKYPQKGEDGLVRFISEDEFNASKANRGTGKPAKVLTPTEKFEKAEKRESRAGSALDNAKKRAKTNPTEYNELNVVKCEAELKMASILLADAQLEAANAPADDTEGQELPEGVTEVTEGDGEALEAEAAGDVEAEMAGDADAGEDFDPLA